MIPTVWVLVFLKADKHLPPWPTRQRTHTIGYLFLIRRHFFQLLFGIQVRRILQQ